MKNASKTKAQLLEELSSLRSRVAELEKPHDTGNGKGQKVSPAVARVDRTGLVDKKKATAGRVRGNKYPPSGNSTVQEAIQETEAQFRVALEDGTVPMATLNPDLQLVKVNRAFCDLLGYTKQALKGRTIKDITHPDDVEHSVDLTTRVFNSGLPSFQFENRFLTKSQTIIWCNVAATVVRDREGKPTYIFVTIENITERKRAENTLRAIVEGTAAVTGADFFHSLLRHLTVTLNAPYAFIAECVDPTNTRARTLAFLKGDTFIENVEYALEGTPCEEVFAGKICFHPEDVQHLFPQDTFLVELDVQCYLGLPLQDSSGKVIGHLVVMSQQPVTFDAQMESLLRIFAARAGAELERKQAEEELHKSQETFKDLFENASLALHMVGPDGIILRVNQAELDMLGYRREEYESRHIAEFHVDQDAIEDILLRLLRGETLRNYEARLRHKDGSIRYVLISSNGKWENDKFIHTRCFTRDITERKQAEEALRETEEHLRFVADNSPVGIAHCDQEQRYKFVNRHFAEMFGLQAPDIVGMSLRELLGEDAYAYARPYLEAVLAGQHPEYDLVLPATRHGQRTVHVSYAPECDTSGQVVGFLASITDITERNQAEADLKASEERYAKVMGAVNDGIWDWEIATNQVFYSSKLKEILGFEEHELQNHYEEWASRIHPEDYDHVMASVKNHLDWNHPYEVEHRLRHKDGTYRWILDRGACARDEQGRPHRMFGSITDITQRKLAEEKVRNTELQLRNSQKLNALGTLAGGIAHDFNNILAAIMGYTELTLGKGPHEEKVQRYLTEVLTAGSRAKELVKQILTFSCQTEGQKRPLHLQEVVKEVLMLIRATLPTTIDIQQQLSVSSDLVQADSTQMHQVLMNLCTNAEYAMRDQGGVLTVRLETMEEVMADGLTHQPDFIPGPHLILHVKDTGHGIPSEILDRIFDPFFTTKEPGKGTGMGLAVVHGIITDHRGHISVTSTSGEGTTVSIVLPLLVAAVADTAETEEELPSAPPLRPGKGHVLLVDDEAPLVALGKGLLEELGYEVTTRTSSLDALEAFRAAPSRYDVVITDQAMPNLSGEALAREILWIRPDIPILLCTGFSHTMTEEKARELGIRKFLMKPVLRRDLVLAIQELMEEKA